MIRIPQGLLDQIKAQAQRTYPEECCGILGGVLGQDGLKTVGAIYPVENARQDSRQTRYLISPDEYRQAELAWQREGFEIVGFYHSHPDHPARPSQYDLGHAWPWYSYLIASVNQGRVECVTSWVLREDRSGFDEESVKTIANRKSQIENQGEG